VAALGLDEGEGKDVGDTEAPMLMLGVGLAVGELVGVDDGLDPALGVTEGDGLGVLLACAPQLSVNATVTTRSSSATEHPSVT